MHRLIFALMLFAAPAVLTSAAFAQPGEKAASVYGDNKAAAEDIPPGFRPVKGAPDVAQIDPNPLVVGAYATFFLGIFVYVVYLARRQADMAKEMEELAVQIQKVDRA